jgi:hypothetical protein
MTGHVLSILSVPGRGLGPQQTGCRCGWHSTVYVGKRAMVKALKEWNQHASDERQRESLSALPQLGPPVGRSGRIPALPYPPTGSNSLYPGSAPKSSLDGKAVNPGGAGGKAPCVLNGRGGK